MASPTIAALRAASSASPAGPSGPQALAYPWMTATGRELVLPDRSSSPPPPKRRPPPDPSPFPSAPPAPPPGQPPTRPPGRRPGDRGEPGGRYMPDEFFLGGGEPQMPVSAPFEPPVTDINLGLMEYIQPVPFAEAGPAESQTPPRRGRDQFEFSPASIEDFDLMDFTPQSIEPLPASAVEVAPEPIPYMPQIVEPEAFSSVPAPQPELSQSVPQSMTDQPEFDPQFLRYLMMSEFRGPNLR